MKARSKALALSAASPMLKRVQSNFTLYPTLQPRDCESWRKDRRAVKFSLSDEGEGLEAEGVVRWRVSFTVVVCCRL